MRPTLNVRLLGVGGAGSGGLASDLRLALASPVQGFDPYRILLQIVSLQALHYLVLCLVAPPCAALFPYIQADRLEFQGGAMSLGLVLDWREISGIPTAGRAAWATTSGSTSAMESDRWDEAQGLDRWWDSAAYLLPPTTAAAEERGPIKVAVGDVGWIGSRPASVHSIDAAPPAPKGKTKPPAWYRATAQDPSRGWSIVLAWVLTGIADVYLLALLVRRPTHILDHTLTLHFWHAVLTTLYTRQLPRSLFYWMVMCAHAGGCVVWAEALAIGREMKGWTSGLGRQHGDDDDEDDNNDDEEQVHEHDGLLRGQAGRTGAHQDSDSQRREERGANNGDDGLAADRPKMKSSRSPTTHVVFDHDEVLDSDQEDEHRDAAAGRKGKANGHSAEAIEMKRLD